MTVTELYEFMKDSFNKIEKRLDEISTLNNRILKLEFQVKILWIASGVIGLSTLSIFLNKIYNLIFN